jgi:uncharacterized protein YecE (DUF72 family)
MALQVRAGTSGYSYKEWRGIFYPDDLPKDEWLGYYASRLPAVEINNTFYRMPRKHVVEGWRDAVPRSFRFVIKASRRITHQSRLKNCEEATGYLLDRANTMGAKLGAVLFQLPPYMRADLDRLQAFQDLLPASLPTVFEFRHESWLDADADQILRERGHGRVISHDESTSDETVPDNAIAYLRLRAFNYTDASLRKWHEKIVASGAKDAFVFFKHEDDGAGPAMAARYLEIASAARPPRRGTKKAVAHAADAKSVKAKPAKAAPRKAAKASPRQTKERG